MSLSLRAGLAAALAALLTFVGGLLVGAKLLGGEMAQQLADRNRDSALLLATLVAHVEPAPERLAQAIEIVTQGGDYAHIRLETVDGEVLFEHRGTVTTSVPAWFSSAAVGAAPGVVVDLGHDGRVFANLSVAVSPESALQAQWRALVTFTLLALAAAVIVGLITAAGLRRLLSPLAALSAQAHSIAEHRYPLTEVRGAAELHPLIEALNALSARSESLSHEHAARICELDRLAGQDELTGLPNRSRFLSLLDATLQLGSANPGQQGSLAVLRVADLTGLNRRFGRAATDKLLVDLAARLRAVAAAHPGRSSARLNGCDFVLIAPDLAQPAALAEELSNALAALESMHGQGLMRRLPIGVVSYVGGESRQRLLARLDGALASAEHTGRGAAHVEDPETVLPALSDLSSWREALESALDAGRIRIDAFPVLDRDGRLLHFEAPSRVLIEDLWYSAEAFLAWAERLGLTARIDLAALRLALARIEAEGEPQGINVSASSLRDAGFLDAFRAELEGRPEAAAALWIELPEQGVVRDLPAFRALCLLARPFGCRLGIEHAGREFGQLGGLHDIGLDYVKIDAGFVHNLGANHDKRDFVVRLCELAHAIGLHIIAEGVDHGDDLEAVRELALDGMTGSAVRL